MPVVVRPTPDYWVELNNQVAGRCLFVGFDGRPHLGQEGFGAFPRRLDKELAVVLAYILSEEVEALIDVSDGGLLRREIESSLLQECLEQGEDFLFEQLSATGRDDQIVGVADQGTDADRRRPDLVRSLVLMDTSADPEPAGRAREYRVMLWMLRTLGYWPLVRRMAKTFFSPHFRNDAERRSESPAVP